MPRYVPTPLDSPAQVGDLYELIRRLQFQIGEGGGPAIVTSTTRPSLPTIGEVIYETDTSSLLTWDGFGWRLPWNLPWGRVADVKVTSAANGRPAGDSDIPGLTVSFVAIKDRRYRIDAQIAIQKHGGGDAVMSLVDAANTRLASAELSLSDLAFWSAAIPGYEFVATASGAVTFKIVGYVNFGTYDVTAFAGKPAWLHVDDAGPAAIQAAPGPPIVTPPPSPGALAVIITTPTPTSTITTGAPLAIGAAAQPDPGQTITSVQFFVDGASIGTDASPPYVASWLTPVAGQHAITATATQSNGMTVSSPSISITVTTAGGGGGGGGGPPPPTASKLHVSGLLLKDPANTTVTLRGVGQYIVPAFVDSSNQMGPITSWFDTHLAAVADDWLAKGINCCRIPLMYDTNQAYVDRVRAAVTTLGTRGIYVILTPMDAVSFGAWPTSGVTFVNDTAEAAAYFLLNAWTACGKPAHLMLELWHEPPGTALTQAEWQSANQAAIAVLRTPGGSLYDGPIFITGRNWGWTFDPTESTAIKNADSNVVFCSHRFAVSSPVAAPLATNDPSTIWKPMWPDGSATAGVAMLMSAFGIYNGGYGVGGSKTGNAQGWGAAMAAEVQSAVAAGHCVGGLGWMWLWGAMDIGEDDENSMVDPAWQQVIGGTPWTTNAWGQVVYGMVTGLGGAAPPPVAGAPTVTVSAPATAAPAATVAITATATAGTGTITKVDFYVDGALLSTDTTSPYTASWTATAGQHQIRAIATQSDAQTATATTSVLVSTPGGTAPLDGWQAQVNGPDFIDMNGNRLVMRGVAQYMVEYTSGGSGAGSLYSWFTSHIGAVALDWKNKGVNMCRIPTTYDTSAGYINDLKAKIDALWAQGIYTMFTAFDGSWGAYNSNTAPDRMFQVWQLLGSPRYCFIETNNEPNGIDAASWAAGMNNWRSRLRAAGYRGIIFMGARDWSWTCDIAQNISIRDSDTNPGGHPGNVCIINHRYAVTDPGQPANGTADVATWKANWPDQCGPNNVCFYMNEWGPWNGGCIAAGIPPTYLGNPCTGPSYGVGGSYNNNVNVWGEALRQEIQNAVQLRHMGGAGGWMWAWSDNNTMTDANPESGTTAYIEGTTGPPWTLNAWGQKMFSMVSVLAGTPTLPGGPTVTHSAPSASIVGQTITVTANATAGSGATITNTALLINGVQATTDATAPYSFQATPSAAGSYQIAVRATQSDGQTATSTPTTLVVSAPASGGPPTVTHSAPTSATTGATVTVTATAVAAAGTTITSTVLLIDGASTGITDTTSPYSFVWTTVAGTHTISVRATQSDAQTATSTATTITVTTPPPPSGGSGALHVAGRTLRLADNTQVFLRGVNQYHFTPYYDGPNSYSEASLSSWLDANRDRVAADWQAQGIRAVRLPMLISDLSTGYKDWVKRVCDSLMTRGIYAVPVLFEAFNDAYTNAATQQRANVFLAHWNYQGRPSMLMCNLWNEPNENGSLSNGQWLAGSEAARQTLRAGGYTGPIFLDANIWATVNDTASFNSLLSNDSAFGGNIVFSQHRYHALCNGGGYLPTNWATSTGNGGWNSNGVAWIYGEFGWHNCYNDPNNAPAFLQDIVTSIINAKNASQMCGAWAWMWVWDDQNTIVQPAYWQIEGGAAWNYGSFWGQQATRMWQNTAQGI